MREHFNIYSNQKIFKNENFNKINNYVQITSSSISSYSDYLYKNSTGSTNSKQVFLNFVFKIVLSMLILIIKLYMSISF